MVFGLAACGKTETKDDSLKVGICNFVDDASLNQIVENIEKALKDSGKDIKINIDNCNTDAAVLDQIISNFAADKVDVMVAIATPVAMAMQGATEDSKTPVVFAAVSDPVGCGVVASMEKPGENITGTSDFLDTDAVISLITAVNPGIDKVALFYDLGQDSSTTAIKAAKAKLDSLNIKYEEFTAGNTQEAQLAAAEIVARGYKAAFTPSDNTIMAAELSIYETLAKGGVQHYAGADSFALNGAFIGYGVDYANLGYETGKMVLEVLDGADPATMAVKTFDNGLAAINKDALASLGMEYETVKAAIEGICTSVKMLETAESF